MAMHVSRHFLGSQPNVLRSIPFAPAGLPDQDGVSLQNRLLALGDWSQDEEQHRLTVANLQVRHGAGGAIQGAAVQELASWVTDGSIRAMEVADLGSGELAIVAGGSRGSLSRLRLTAPLAPGADSSEIQLKGEGDMEGASLLPWQQLHRGSVAALDVNSDTREVVSAGEDGALFVVPLDAAPSSSGRRQQQPFAEPRSSASYRAARWASQSTFVTAGTTGGLECWDKRRPGRAQLRSPLAWGLTGCGAQGLGARIDCVAVHPSRPHLCVTGAQSGTVAVWDLRFAARPACHGWPEPGAGEVWEVHFDPFEPLESSAAAPDSSVLFCTSGGVLGSLSTGPASGGSRQPLQEVGAQPQQQQRGSTSGASVLYKEVCSGIDSFDVEKALGQDIFCATEQECLVHLSRPVK